jgi:hypothetical protein
MNSFGIYFGDKSLGLSETKGRKLVNNLHVDRSILGGGEGGEKVPDELKIVALLKDHLRRYKITANEAVVSLSSRDLIVRTFDIPIMPPDELKSAIVFEAKKYVPFKIEELVSDYHVTVDRPNKRNLIVFVGIKKDILAKYVSMIAQLGLKISGLEYYGFSMMRLASLAGVPNRGVCALVSAGTIKEGETNFMVMDNGFPLFCRDIVLGGEAPAVTAESESVPPVANGGSMLAEKLKTELRVSFDFYSRKFSGKRITTLYYIAPDELRQEIESFAREMGVVTQSVDVSKLLGVGVPYSIGQTSSFSASLMKSVKSGISVNLLSPKSSAFSSRKLDANINVNVGSMISGFIFDPKSVVFGALICAGVYGYGEYRMVPFKNQLKETVAKRLQFDKMPADDSLESLQGLRDEYERKIQVFDRLIRNQMLITAPLNSIPTLLPEGIWLTGLNFVSREDGDVELEFSGLAYLEDGEQEMLRINEFLGNLASDQAFTQAFRDIKLVTMDRVENFNVKSTTFSIRCVKTRKR